MRKSLALTAAIGFSAAQCGEDLVDLNVRNDAVYAICHNTADKEIEVLSRLADTVSVTCSFSNDKVQNDGEAPEDGRLGMEWHLRNPNTSKVFIFPYQRPWFEMASFSAKEDQNAVQTDPCFIEAVADVDRNLPFTNGGRCSLVITRSRMSIRQFVKIDDREDG